LSKVNRAAAQGQGHRDPRRRRREVACIFGQGETRRPASSQPATVEEVRGRGSWRLPPRGGIDPDSGGSAGLRNCGGASVVRRPGHQGQGDLTLIHDLAAASAPRSPLLAPACDDMRWYGPERVVGRRTPGIAPEPLHCRGISGQPLARAARCATRRSVVVINNDPRPRSFKICDYGILGDLYKVVPALTAALSRSDDQAPTALTKQKRAALPSKIGDNIMTKQNRPVDAELTLFGRR